jgi:hypothetical protein
MQCALYTAIYTRIGTQVSDIGLCRSSLFLAAILVALSPHPKIPFLADKAQRADTRFCPTEAARRDFPAISRDFLQPPFGLCRQIKSL